MKKSVIVLFSVLCLNVNAQEHEHLVSKGNVIIEPFYGYPYLGTSILKASYSNSEYYKSLNTTNHLGFRFEVLISDKVGLGLEATYAAAVVHYEKNSMDYSAGIQKYRILGKFNLHLAGNKILDSYLTCGIGYLEQKYFQTESGDNNLKHNSFIEAQLPVGGRVGVGLRYFPHKNFGIHGEIGLGGPILQGGLSFRF